MYATTHVNTCLGGEEQIIPRINSFLGEPTTFIHLLSEPFFEQPRFARHLKGTEHEQGIKTLALLQPSAGRR